MSWRDDLHLNGKGSFRGVEFFVNNVESTIGRRTVVHEFPGRNLPMVEDLGLMARRFSLDCYVLGEDYFDQRDALVREFELGGTGPLVHPYWGTMTVAVTGGVRIRETTAEGGMARISVNVVRSDIEDVQPTESPDTEQATRDAADEAVTASSEQFQGVEVEDDAVSTARADQFKRGDIPDDDAWTVFGVIGHVRDEALILGNEATSFLNSTNKYINAVTNVSDDVDALIDEFDDSLTTLILTPDELANEIQGLMATVFAKVLAYEGIWQAYAIESEKFFNPAATPEAEPSSSTPDSGGRLNTIIKKIIADSSEFGDEFQEVTGTTPMELIEAGNQRAFIALVKHMSVAEICRVIVQFQFGSFDEAIAMRDLLANYLDDLAEEGGDLVYRAMIDLRSAITKHLTEAAEDLPRIIDYVPPKTTTALSLSQRLYGDSRRDIDIITRNNLRNPLKVAGGASLQVLSDD
jgi:prophage DNA circulation protein